MRYADFPQARRRLGLALVLSFICAWPDAVYTATVSIGLHGGQPTGSGQHAHQPGSVSRQSDQPDNDGRRYAVPPGIAPPRRVNQAARIVSSDPPQLRRPDRIRVDPQAVGTTASIAHPGIQQRFDDVMAPVAAD